MNICIDLENTVEMDAIQWHQEASPEFGPWNFYSPIVDLTRQRRAFTVHRLKSYLIIYCSKDEITKLVRM